MRRLILLLILTVSGTAAFGADPIPLPSPSPTATPVVSAVESEDAEYSSYRLSSDDRESRLTFGFFGQIAQFSRQGESLMAYAAEALVGYGLTRNFALQFALDQAVSSEGGISIAYTGLRSGIAYALTGEFIKTNSILKVNEQPVVAFHAADQPQLLVDAGLDQFFFNGTSRITPATGMSAGIRYDRTVWGYRASIGARYGMLVISEETVPMMTVGAGLLFSY